MWKFAAFEMWNVLQAVPRKNNVICPFHLKKMPPKVTSNFFFLSDVNVKKLNQYKWFWVRPTVHLLRVGRLFCPPGAAALNVSWPVMHASLPGVVLLFVFAVGLSDVTVLNTVLVLLFGLLLIWTTYARRLWVILPRACQANRLWNVLE